MNSMETIGGYELGKVYAEDCLVALKRIPDNSIDFIFTDPPYGHNNNNGDMASRRESIFEKRTEKYVPESEWRPIANDGIEANELVRQSFAEFNRILKAGSCCCCCCCCGGGPDPQFARWSQWIDEAIGFKMMVVWDKGKMGMGHHYRRSYETILVAQKKGGATKWYAESKDIENIIRPNDYGIAKIIPAFDQHPTEKCVELSSHFIKLHTLENDIVLDCFAGSGSTLQAAKQLNRRFIGFDIDLKWAIKAQQRADAARYNERLAL